MTLTQAEPPTVVIRLSSLGDVILAGAVTAELAPVTFVTRAAWAPVAARLPGVVDVCVWPRQPLPARGAVVDLHHNLRTVWLTLGRQVRRVRRHDLARRLRVWAKTAPAPRVVDRYAEAAGISAPAERWLEAAGSTGTLVLVPGARWATKRWPEERWVSLGTRWTGPVVVCGGPSDLGRVNGIARAIGPRTEALAEEGFAATWHTVAGAAAVVAGDTGLMHLAGAMGVPLVALFGPTTSADGFWCHAGAVVEEALTCRPCSRFGGPACPKGHHKCMTRLSVDRVWQAVEEVRR